MSLAEKRVGWLVPCFLVIFASAALNDVGTGKPGSAGAFLPVGADQSLISLFLILL